MKSTVPPWPVNIYNARLVKNVTLQWVPSHSCAVAGCSKLAWHDVLNADATNGVCFVGSLAPGLACYCDDACTRYKVMLVKEGY